MAPTRAELRTVRVLLGAVSVALPIFGLRSQELPASEVSWGVRALFSIVARAGLLASRSPTATRGLRPFGIMYACSLLAWYVWSGAQEGTSQGQVISVMLMGALSTLMFHRVLELVAFAAFVTALLAYAYQGIAELGISLLLVCTLATVTVDIPPDTILHTDPRHLRQILGNLLSNAVKFTQAGSVRIEARREAGSLLSVSDTGVGSAFTLALPLRAGS